MAGLRCGEGEEVKDGPEWGEGGRGVLGVPPAPCQGGGWSALRRSTQDEG